MALSPNINDLEKDKFIEDVDLGTAVKTLTKLTGTGTIGDVNISAPTGPFRNTVVLVTDVATAFPAVPLADRASLSIQNKSATNTVYVGPDNTVTADTVVGTTSGFEIGPDASSNFDLDDTNDIYFICEAGKTALLKITEVAST